MSKVPAVRATGRGSRCSYGLEAIGSSVPHVWVARFKVPRQIDKLPFRVALQNSSILPSVPTRAAGSRSCEAGGPGGRARMTLQSPTLGLRPA